MSPSDPIPMPTALLHAGRGRRAQRALSTVLDVIELLKIRVGLLVLVTTFVGYRLAEASLQLGVTGRLPLGGAEVLIHVLVGTFCLGTGASALNQYLERDVDAMMDRTRKRPLPSGRLSPAVAQGVGVSLSVGGVVYLAFLVHPLCAAVGATTSVIYAFVYTPLKRRTKSALTVGAVAGALPPLIGWVAATGSLGGAAWSLFAVQFIWQTPHFHAIAWIHREDYRRGGHRPLTVLEPDGFRTAVEAVAWSLALIPASLTFPLFFQLGGSSFVLVALGLGFLFVGAAVVFAVRRSKRTARALLIVSVIYLPALFLSLVASL